MAKSSVKRKLAKFTGNYTQVDKKILGMKKSWDEVDKLLQPSAKKAEKKGDAKKSDNKKQASNTKKPSSNSQQGGSKTASMSSDASKKNNTFNYQDFLKNKLGTMNKK